MPDSEDLTLYQPPKALEVLGFTARDNVPRHCFMRVSVLHFCGVHVQIGAQSDSSCISTQSPIVACRHSQPKAWPLLPASPHNCCCISFAGNRVYTHMPVS